MKVAIKTWMIFLTFFGVIILQKECEAQRKDVIPENYIIYKDLDNRSYKLEEDLDGDEIPDRVIVYTKKDSEFDKIVAVYLSTAARNGNTFYSFPFSALSYDLKFNNKVFTISACFGNGRYCKTLKFKYYPTIRNFRLIGYEEESFGNAMHDGAYLKSVNLLTNKYEISGPKWKKKIIRKLTLHLVSLEKLNDKEFEYLESIGSQYSQS